MLRRIVICSALLVLAAGAAQAAESFEPHRAYEAQVIPAAHFPNFLESPVRNLVLARYEADSGRWQVVPFQIDEVTPSGSYFGAPRPNLKPQDELVFMVRDLGDPAPAGSWPGEWGTPTDRYELQAVDPNAPGAARYIYLFRLPGEFTYQGEDLVSADRAQDRIVSRYYTMGFHPNNGLPVDLAVTAQNGGDGLDLLDRLKIHLLATVNVFGQPVDIPINEENSIQKAPPDSAAVNPLYLDGPVRVVRDFLVQFKLDLGPSVGVLPLPGIYTVRMHFFPYSMMVSLPGVDLSPLQSFGGSLKQIRLSFDYSPHAMGMTFQNPQNSVKIDGVPDAVVPTISPGQLNWMMVTGTPGTVLNLTLIPKIGTQQVLYYYDNLHSGGTALDGTEDTGDMVSIGDSGFLVSGTITSGKLDFLSYTFFLPPGQTGTDAAAFLQNIQHPLQVQFRYQPNTTSAADKGAARSPDGWRLRVFPNPLSLHGTGPLHLQISLRRTLKVQPVLVDLLGRRTALSAPLRLGPGSHVLSFVLPRAKTLAAGVYWLVLENGETRLAKRILLLP